LLTQASELPLEINLEFRHFFFFAPAALKAGRDARAPGKELCTSFQGDSGRAACVS
jgi:hypothetical protein